MNVEKEVIPSCLILIYWLLILFQLHASLLLKPSLPSLANQRFLLLAKEFEEIGEDAGEGRITS
jgi:hypothetical protein